MFQHDRCNGDISFAFKVIDGRFRVASVGISTIRWKQGLIGRKDMQT